MPHAFTGIVTAGLLTPSSSSISIIEIAKFNPSDAVFWNVTTPMTSPLVFTSGPPLLPGLTAASVCIIVDLQEQLISNRIPTDEQR